MNQGCWKLNCDKALHFLDWHAVMNFEDTVNMTSEWYKAFIIARIKLKKLLTIRYLIIF